MPNYPAGFSRQRFVMGVACALLAAVVVAAAGSPQTPPPPAQRQADDQQKPTFRTEANLVRVDAFPTIDGAPVLDLTRDDFQVFEDGVAQTVESFEHVVVRPAGAEAARVEPNTQREGYEMGADPHNRVFVIFLDTYHVSYAGSYNIRRPLINMIDRLLGPDDLVGVITPDQPASQLILARKTDVVARGLTDTWFWGSREQLYSPDPIERMYEMCYPAEQGRRRSFIADEMIQRRRERQTLSALRDLVRHLNGIREERKAIITVSDGWLLFRPNEGLAMSGQPVPPGVFVTPRGTLSTTDERAPEGATMSKCDADRRELGWIDDWQYFRDLVQEASRDNASFYPVDPRGLPAFDTSIGADSIDPRWSPTPITTDLAMLREREESLRTAAAGTDGLPVLGSNDIDSGLKRVVADLNSYYLLGYYSTNTALDGNWRKIEVKVARTGVDVRARRGYRAASAEEIAAATAAAERPPVDAERAAVDEAVARLGTIRHDTELFVDAIPLIEGGRTVLKVVAELDVALVRRAEWQQGSEAALMVTGKAGASLALARVKVSPGARTFEADVPLSGAEALTECALQVRLSAGRTVSPLGEVVRVALPGPAAPMVGAPLLFRRGPTTGNVWTPAADMRFNRSERVRLEAPLAAGAASPSARLLDRTGQPLEVPVVVTERTDGAQRWLVAEVTLAPLTNGDYVVELTAAEAGQTAKTMVGVRVVR